MRDYLKELCDIAEIELVYNENKLVIISSAVKNDKPILRVHRIFSSGTREIAKAIVSYFTRIDSTNEDLMVINNYAINRLGTSKIKIIPPDREFLKFFNNGITRRENQINSEEVKKTQPDDENIEEAKIESIIQKDFYGNISSRKTDNSINTRDEDFIELDIVINRYKA